LAPLAHDRQPVCFDCADAVLGDGDGLAILDERVCLDLAADAHGVKLRGGFVPDFQSTALQDRWSVHLDHGENRLVVSQLARSCLRVDRVRRRFSSSHVVFLDFVAQSVNNF